MNLDELIQRVITDAKIAIAELEVSVYLLQEEADKARERMVKIRRANMRAVK